MNSSGHVAVGLTAYAGGMVVASAVLPDLSVTAGSVMLGIAGTTLGSVLPDVDTPHSTIGKAFRPVSRFISAHVEHRTITHSWLFIGLMLLPAISTGWHVFWAMNCAVFLHILVDSFSRQGVLWTYPLKQWDHYRNGGQYKKGRSYNKGYAVGGPFEQLIVHLCWVILLFLVCLLPFFVVG